LRLTRLSFCLVDRNALLARGGITPCFDPDSFESSSGVRWFAMTLCSEQQKSRRRNASSASRKLLVVVDRNQRAALKDPSQQCLPVMTEAKRAEAANADVDGLRSTYLAGDRAGATFWCTARRLRVELR